MKRTLIHVLSVAAAALMVMTLPCCKRRPLVDVGNTHYVRVYLDEQIKNVTTGFYDETLDKPDYSSPEMLRVALYDPSDGHVVAERYLRNKGSDDRGTFYDGYVIANPGNYMLLTYNFGTESTVIDNGHLYYEAEAYTNPISATLLSQISSRGRSEDEKIVYVPDHLFVDNNEHLYIPYGDDIDTLRNEAGDHYTGQSIVLSYYLQIRVKGIEWVSSAVGLLTGMAGSATLNDGLVNAENPVTVYFDMKRSETVGDEAFIYTTFNTFGKLPDKDNELSITFDIKTTDGRAMTTTIDISDKFSEPDAVERQWLLLDQVLNIPEPEDPENEGGFAPGVDDWTDIETDIII